VKFEGPLQPNGLQQWYENDALLAYYQYGRTALFNKMEARICLLYNFLEKQIMPWQWDYDRYMDNNADMIGFFYPEDLAAILQIQGFESERRRRESQSKK